MSKKTPTTAGELETITRLLDAAEKLFGEHGYDGVGMRELAAQAKVNLGAATYHFGSKKALYIETFMRRFRPTNAEQLNLLRSAQTAAKTGGKKLSVETIMDCLARPPFLRGLEHPNFTALLARNRLMPPQFLQAVMQRELLPMFEEFIAALQQVLRNVPVELLRLRLLFSMGSLLSFSLQISKLKTPRNSQLAENALKELIRFISAGLECAPAAANRTLFAPHTKSPLSKRSAAKRSLAK